VEKRLFTIGILVSDEAIPRSTSAHSGIVGRLRLPGKRCNTESAPGRTSPTSLLLHKVHDRRQCCRFLSHDRVNRPSVDKAMRADRASWNAGQAPPQVAEDRRISARVCERPW
jgi:hypothetical protein